MDTLLLAQVEGVAPDAVDSTLTRVTSIFNTLADDTPWLRDITFAGNELWRWLALGMAILVAVVLGRIVRFALLRAVARAETRNRPVVAVVLRSLEQAVWLLAVALGISIGVQFLALTPAARGIANKGCGVIMATAVGYAVFQLVAVVDYWLRSFTARTHSRLDDMLAPLVTKSLRTVVAVLFLAQVVQIITGMAPASIVAGLGVGGLAVGLAAQDTIKNIFGSLMIFSDRPFELGDTITVDGNTGVVETVGFRSTRFRTGDGHVVTIPNGDLANKAIINVSRRRNLKRTLVLPLPPNLTAEQMEQVIDLLKEILANHEGMLPSLPPKVQFTDISPTSLSVQIMYWFHPPDANQMAALNERVNLEIMRRLQAAGITLAVPVQRVEVDKIS